MKILDIITESKTTKAEAPKPRNFVAKNAKMGGAGQHKDKKKAAKQGDVKHKSKEIAEGLNPNDLVGYVYDSKNRYLGQWNGQRLVIDPAVWQRWKDENGQDWASGMVGMAKDRIAAGVWKVQQEKQGMAREGRHGYDDHGMSLAPGHDEGEPVYNPRYDRTGQYDRKAKFSKDYNYNTGKPLGAPSERKGFIFYNVNDTQTAQQLGLKQTKSGKWYLPTGNVHGQQTADKVFGKGKIWYPKESVGESRVDEKAVSKAQQKFMGMVYAAKKGEKPASKEVAKAAKGMSKKSAKDYAATKHKDLPGKVGESATAGSTSAANMGVGAVYPNKTGKTYKNKDGTAKNALDVKGANLMTGGSIKR